MISRTESPNFFAAHYDWLLTGVGVLALAAAAAFFVMARGEDPDEMAAAKAQEVERMKTRETGVTAVDMTAYHNAMRLTKSPVVVAEVGEKTASFLASERRVKCKCGKVISGDVKLFPKCPFCGEKQEEEKVVVLDADNDGLPDEWERKIGLNPNDASDGAADLDKDGFTNLEEYQAKTDPKDPNDHPDYLDSLKIVLPLKETYMPFVFTKATQIPSGWRCEFFDAKQKDDYGRLGRTLTATIGEEVGAAAKKPAGFVLKSYDKKEEKRARKGMKGMTMTVDVSEAVVERKSDGKVIKLVLAASKKTKPAPVDVQATLAYERGETKKFDVVPGSEFDLNGTKYKVVELKQEGKGAKMTVANVKTGKKRTLSALEQ